MPELQAPPPLPKSQPPFLKRNSTVIKLFGVGALVLVMLETRNPWTAKDERAVLPDIHSLLPGFQIQDIPRES